jgi:hypothetical protein
MSYKLLLVTFIFFLSAFISIKAQDKNFGIGIILGEPTGLSGKYWMSPENAFDAGLAYSFMEDNKSFAFHADYLYHAEGVIDKYYKMPLYYGFGVRFRVREIKENTFGVRGVIGLLIYLKDAPVDVFLEAAPVFRLLPDTNIDFDIAVGARYFFDNL